MKEAEIQVKTVSTPEDIEKLRPFWSELNLNPESDIDFVQILAKARPEILGLHVLAAYENDKLVALLIGRIENAVVTLKFGYWKLLNLRLKRVVFVREGFLGECSDRVAEAMVTHLVKSDRAVGRDVSLLCNVPVTGALNNAIKKHCPALRKGFSARVAERWRGRLPETYDAFMTARSRKHRGHLRRLFRIVEAEFPGQIRYENYTQPSQVNAFCEAADTIAQHTYQRGLNAGFIDNEENRRRLALAAEKGWFKGYIVFAQDKPLAFWYGDLVKGVMHLGWTGYLPEYRDFELGTILYLKMTEDLISLKARELDYGLGAAHYKERFGDICLQEVDTAIYSANLKGWFCNVMLALEAVVNRVGARLLSKLKLKERMKKKWRSGLAETATSAATEAKAEAEA